jgi:hypothetical protein
MQVDPRKDIQPGQIWSIKAHYEYDKNNGVVHSSGKRDHVMVIAIMYVELL